LYTAKWLRMFELWFVCLCTLTKNKRLAHCVRLRIPTRVWYGVAHTLRQWINA
jgi:hypothetical protein